MAHPLSQQIADTAKFTAVHAGLVPEDEASLPWLVTGTVLMVQQACTLALSEAGADIPAMPGPGELAARVSDPDILEQPFTAPLKPADHRALEPLIAARNAVMHPAPDGLAHTEDCVAEGVLTAVKLVRHLVLTQPVRPSMMGQAHSAAIRHSLSLIGAGVDFWQTVRASS